MIARRFIGMLTGICALSLTLGRSAEGCERPNAKAPPASASMTMAQHAAAQHESPASRHHGKSCDSSTVVCCQAMTSCGLTFAAGPTDSAGAELSAATRVTQIELQTPLSRIAGPETPPPKA